MLAGRPFVDGQLAEAIRDPVEGLREGIASVGLPVSVTEHLCPLAAGIENNRQLAEITLTKTLGRGAASGHSIETLTRALTAVETAYRLALPSVVDELTQRSGPLMLQWEARGPGMLSEIARRTEPGLLVERAEVILVHPVVGGSGTAHLPYNSVRIEAVLADPIHELPEVVRLAWLISALNTDLPKHSDHLPVARHSIVGSLAMLPAALCAGEHVELTRFDRPTLATAASVWFPEEELAPERRRATPRLVENLSAKPPPLGNRPRSIGPHAVC